MKKLLLLILILLSVGLIGCSDDVEKERIEKKHVQTIKVEGNCRETHTTVNDVYEGSIALYVELPSNIFFVVGYVSQKDPMKHLSWIETLSEHDNDEFWIMSHTYVPPFLIEFTEFDSQDQDTIFKSKLKLNGISNPPDPNKGSLEPQYHSTCLFDVLERGKFEHGEKEGKWIYRYRNGQIKKEENYKDGKRDGKWTEWDENGRIIEETNYKDGKFDGKRTFWHENGQKEAEGIYKDGEYDYKWTVWHENGQIRAEATYKDGKNVSQTDYHYYDNGQIKEERNYKDGKEDGKWTQWYENGHKEAEGYYKDGKKDDKWTYWHENGQIKEEINYKDGECISGDCD